MICVLRLPNVHLRNVVRVNDFEICIPIVKLNDAKEVSANGAFNNRDRVIIFTKSVLIKYVLTTVLALIAINENLFQTKIIRNSLIT